MLLKILISFVLLGSLLFASLPQWVSGYIGAVGLKQSEVAIKIERLGANSELVASLNENRLFRPASVNKVLTLYASLLKLGFNHRIPTAFYTNAKIASGHLRGDLKVRAGGDPSLDYDALSDIVSQIKSLGIRTIDGDLVIDRSIFRVGSSANSHFDENTYAAYNAMPDGMMFDGRVSHVDIYPNRRLVSKRYRDDSFRVSNGIRWSKGSCRGRLAWPHSKIVAGATPTLKLSGSLSVHCPKRSLSYVLSKPYYAFYGALKKRLRAAGITLKGRLRLRAITKNDRVLFVHYSKPLAKLAAHTAKKSDNLYAKELYLYLASRLYGNGVGLNEARKALKEILQQSGVIGNERFYCENGSGLSRKSLVSAEIFAKVLKDAYRRYGRRWMELLSIAGVDGTIKRRFASSVVKRHAWMKTGTLKNAKNIAGYVKGRDGSLYSVVILTNSNRGNYRGAKLQNLIITHLVRGNKAPIKAQEHGYYVQAGIFFAPPSNDFIAKIKALNLPFKIEKKAEYRLLIGPYGDLFEAKRVAALVINQLQTEAFILKR